MSDYYDIRAGQRRAVLELAIKRAFPHRWAGCERKMLRDLYRAISESGYEVTGYRTQLSMALKVLANAEKAIAALESSLPSGEPTF